LLGLMTVKINRLRITMKSTQAYLADLHYIFQKAVNYGYRADINTPFDL